VIYWGVPLMGLGIAKLYSEEYNKPTGPSSSPSHKNGVGERGGGKKIKEIHLGGVVTQS